MIFLVLIGFLIPSVAFAQYQGGADFYHIPLTVDSKQYSVLAQSNTNYFTGVVYDSEANSLIFSTSASEDFIDTYTITMNEQTFSELLATDYAETPDSMLVLINGVEQPYRTFQDNNIISWRFYATTSSDEVELISSTPRFDTGTYKLDKIPNGSPKIYPPLKQSHIGMDSENIQCNDDLVLIQKYDGSPACVTELTKEKLIERGWIAKNGSSILDWKKYIIVSASRIDKSEFTSISHIVNFKDLPQNDLLQTLLYGADGCKNETEVCRISGGVSIDRFYPFLTSPISNNDMYSVTLTSINADDLLSSYDWNSSEDLLYSIMQRDGKYYLLIMSTFENTQTPDVKMALVGTTHEPVSLKRGETLNYTIQVNTWATYGVPAKIDLRAVQDTKDSGIDVWVDPPTITIPERSNATSTLFIKAHDDANDGLYDVRVIGHANGKLADLYCRNTICPTINIGNSSWSIRTFGSGSDMGIGGIESPSNTFLELELNKKEFFEDDIVEIKTYLVNNSTEKISFVPDRLLVKVIKAQDVGYYDNLYGIDARYESDELLVLEPNSKTLLVRPFYWNQNTFDNFDDAQRVDTRQHKMIAKFVGEKYAWNDDVWFEVK